MRNITAFVFSQCVGISVTVFAYKYADFKDWRWREFYENITVDLDAFLDKYVAEGRTMNVGTDSKIRGKYTFFATAIIAHRTNTGGSVIINKAKVPTYPSLRQKLLMEAMRTLETAWYLAARLSDDVRIRLHVDVNNELKWQSGQYKEELVGMIMGQGFVSYKDVIGDPDNYPRLVYWKPASWAASSVADLRT